MPPALDEAMAKHRDRLSFRDAVRAEEDGHEQESLLADEEQQDGASNHEESYPPESLPVYLTIHK